MIAQEERAPTGVELRRLERIIGPRVDAYAMLQKIWPEVRELPHPTDVQAVIAAMTYMLSIDADENLLELHQRIGAVLYLTRVDPEAS